MRTLFLNVACVLALFNIEAPVDEKLEAIFNKEVFLRCVTTMSRNPRFYPLPRSLRCS